MPLCEERDVGIILGGPFNSGILATGPVPGANFNGADAPLEILRRVNRMDKVCKAHGTRLIDAALRFVLGHPSVKSVIPGAPTAAEVRSNVSRLAQTIPHELWLDLLETGLIRKNAPIPTHSARFVQR